MSIDLHTIGSVNDCDGAEIGDIDDDGKMDVAACESTGTPRIFWFEQGINPDSWTQRTIYTGGTKHEGITLGDFNGDNEIEVISLDQTEGKIRLHKPSVFGNPTGAWDTVELITGRSGLQDAQAIDIDGDGNPEIVYTWEGDANETGGVNWLDFGGGTVTTPADWDDYVMVQHDGAWWLASSGRVDLAGNGDVDIVFTARDNLNPAAEPGVYWLEKPGIVTNPWTEHTIDNTVSDWLHCDVGDFSGNGTEKDVIANHELGNPTWYDFDNAWAPSELHRPGGSGAGNKGFNLRTSSIRMINPNDFLFIVANDGIFYFRNMDNGYGNYKSLDIDYDHPMDDRIIWYDIDGDGINEAIIPDSGGNRLVWLDFSW